MSAYYTSGLKKDAAADYISTVIFAEIDDVVR